MYFVIYNLKIYLLRDYSLFAIKIRLLKIAYLCSNYRILDNTIVDILLSFLTVIKL
jgi:hypothetical protein